MALTQYTTYDESKPARLILLELAQTYNAEVTALKHSAVTKDEIAKIKAAETAAMRADPEYQDAESKQPHLDKLRAKYTELIERMRDVTRATFRDLWVKGAIEKKYVEIHYESGAGAVGFYEMKPISWRVKDTGDLAGGVKRYDDKGYRTFSSFGFVSMYLTEDTFDTEYDLTGEDIDYYHIQKLADVVVFKDDKLELGEDIGGTNIEGRESDLPIIFMFGDSPQTIYKWEDLYFYVDLYFQRLIEKTLELRGVWGDEHYLNFTQVEKDISKYYALYQIAAELMPLYTRTESVQTAYANFTHVIQYSVTGFINMFVEYIKNNIDWPDKLLSHARTARVIAWYSDGQWDWKRCNNINYRKKIMNDWATFNYGLRILLMYSLTTERRLFGMKKTPLP